MYNKEYRTFYQPFLAIKPKITVPFFIVKNFLQISVLFSDWQKKSYPQKSSFSKNINSD